MKLLLAIFILIIIPVVGSRMTFFNRQLSLGFRNLLLTGTEYVFIGVLLGGMGLNILDAESLEKLEPFLIFALCWIGFLFGLQFKVRQLKMLPGYYFSISAIQALLSFIMVTGVTYFVFKSLAIVSDRLVLLVSVSLGSSASCTAQSALTIVSHNYKFKNRRVLDLMRYISGIDGFYALCFFALAMSIFPGGEIETFSLLASLKWLLISCAMGVLPALIFISLSRIKFSSQELFLYIIGTVIFCGGLAYQINYSPLVSGFICGIIIANYSRHRFRVLSEIMPAEKSIYIILLLLLGAGWDFKIDLIFLIAGIYIIMRALGKYIGTFVGLKAFKTGYPVPSTLGLGLLSEGGFAVAIILNFKLLYPFIADTLITIIVISVLVNELIGPWLILAQFKKEEWTMVNVRQKLKDLAKKRE
jgi:Kef-type K+ transport system membrane component KefB